MAGLLVVIALIAILVLRAVFNKGRPLGEKPPLPPETRRRHFPAPAKSDAPAEMHRGYVIGPGTLLQPPSAPPPATPTSMSSARYRVCGVDRESKMDTEAYYEAASAENAKVKAELDGIVVTRVEQA